ncbi:MAG TPA: sodium:proline symporter, partial [Gammaproteobacteria bacterium]|nr:sodium:proline symporter [Gammaproteobacteria bacterium]
MITLIVFIIYAVLILGITFRAYRQTQNYQDYILGSRRFGGVVTAMGVAATDMSAWLMMSVPAVFYLYGLDQIWLPLGLLLGSFVNWHWVAPRLRVYTQVAKNSLTLPSFFQHRFVAQERALIRPISAVIFLIFFTCYAASGFVGAAKLVSTIFNLDYNSALFYSAPIVIAYTAIGGYLAVNWLDLLQGFLMFFALFFLALCAYFALNAQLPLTIVQLGPEYLDIFHEVSVISLVSALGWGLGYFGQPHILVRFMSSHDPHSIRIGKYVCLTWMFFALASAAAVGLLGVFYFPMGSLSSAEIIFPALAQHLLSPWFAAITFAAIISAIISTV